ncbi:MAG: hypothetical protein M3Y42_04360 [Actinomycetota bacterium]|nr:hypothetical protein [Actinomycetota bacterium]MDQ2956180.1 hypothetical protein [Actinomycetota bacterium]
MTTDTDRSVEVLHALNRIGAINLDVLLGQAAEVQGALKEHGITLEPGDICYKFTMHIGPRLVDLVSVAAEVERLGFTLSRAQR